MPGIPSPLGPLAPRAATVGLLRIGEKTLPGALDLLIKGAQQ